MCDEERIDYLVSAQHHLIFLLSIEKEWCDKILFSLITRRCAACLPHSCKAKNIFLFGLLTFELVNTPNV